MRGLRMLLTTALRMRIPSADTSADTCCGYCGYRVRIPSAWAALLLTTAPRACAAADDGPVRAAL
eukprot:12800275-Heterocapsa_arctica.AAC.1